MRVTTKVIALEPTTVCTLRCKLCALGVPYLKKPHHEKLENVFKELKEVFKIWDYAERVDIGGGEPLMHKQLPEIVLELLKYREHYGEIRIVTNCTLMPSDELWKVIQDNSESISFLLDDYGVHSPLAKTIAEECDIRNISYKYNVYFGDDQFCGGWIDFGGWEDRNYSESQLKKVYNKCHTSENPCVTLYGGAAYFCCRSLLGELMGVFNSSSSEKIDLFDETVPIEEKRNIAKEFGKSIPIACRYCDGFNTEAKRYPAAEQL